MLAGQLVATDAADPVAGFGLRSVPEPSATDGAVVVRVRAAALNQHDLWVLRGAYPVAHVPITLGSDAAGVRTDTGEDVVVHALLAGAPERWPSGDETLSSEFGLLGDKIDGTLAELVAVPARNVVPKPPSLSWTEAACLPTAWLTAWRALTTRGRACSGEHVLVQGASGGVSTAALLLAKALGCRVTVTSRCGEHLARALELGADDAVESGGRLSAKADLVLDTVGAATWGHSLRSVAPGGRIVTAGATTGTDPAAELGRLYLRGVDIRGTSMGTLTELGELCRFVDECGLHPVVGRVDPLDRAADGLAALSSGSVFGKAVVQMGS